MNKQRVIQLASAFILVAALVAVPRRVQAGMGSGGCNGCDEGGCNYCEFAMPDGASAQMQRGYYSAATQRCYCNAEYEPPYAQ